MPMKGTGMNCMSAKTYGTGRVNRYDALLLILVQDDVIDAESCKWNTSMCYKFYITVCIVCEVLHVYEMRIYYFPCYLRKLYTTFISYIFTHIGSRY